MRLHYIDGNYTVLPEVVEASLGPHMQVYLFFLLSFQFVNSTVIDWNLLNMLSLCYAEYATA